MKMAKWEALILMFGDPFSVSFPNPSKDVQYSLTHLAMDFVSFAISPY